MRNWFIKRSTASDYLLLFLVSGVISVIGTRLWLQFWNYPQIGHGQIHFAHSLIGVLFLAAANVISFSFHGRKMRQFVAVLGGFGFGLSVDEIGKFLTRDNNYFYQPVPMIIYLSFISLFLLYRYLDRYTPFQPKEIIYDILENLEEIAESRPRLKTQHSIQSSLEKMIVEGNENATLFRSQMLHFISNIHVTSRKNSPYMQKNSLVMEVAR